MKTASGILFLGVVLTSIATFAHFSTEAPITTDENALRLYCNRETAYSTGVSDARKGLSRKEDFGEICQVNRDFINVAYNSGYNFGLTNQSGLIVNEPAPVHPANQYQLPSSQAQIYTRPVAQAPNGYAVAPGSTGATLGPGTPGGNTSVGNGLSSTTPRFPGEQDLSTGDLARPTPVQGLKALVQIQPSSVPKCIQTTTGQACGFNCVNSMNNVRCAATPDQICRSNDNGTIACGYNCIATHKTVRCAAFSTDGCVGDVNGYVFCGQNCRIDGNATAVCDIERYAP